jgi:cysteine desulfurase/selenocysteine lyase
MEADWNMKPATLNIERETAALNLDPAALRQDFPILKTRVHNGKPLIYLDNAATTQKPQSVIQALSEYYQATNANVHRGLHYLAEQATLGYEAVRAKVAGLINAPDVRSIIFTRGTTEGINLVAHGWGRKFIRAGDEIVLSEMEHHSNMIPWQLLAREKGAFLRYIPVLDDGTLDMQAYHRLLGPRVKLVSVTQMSNVLGTINPIREMAASAHGCGAVFVVDAAQSVPHGPVDVQDLDCDFLAFSGHKMCGPTGIGVLYGKREILDEMDPFMGGGEMIMKVFWDHATWAEVPHKFEAGTPPIAEAFGLGAAIDYLRRIGMENIQMYDRKLTRYALRRLKEVPGLRIFGRAPLRGGVISFELAGIHAHDVAQFADQEGIAIRAGHHCAQPLMRKMGVPATGRASVYFYNLEWEIDRLVEALIKTKDFFEHGH